VSWKVVANIAMLQKLIQVFRWTPHTGFIFCRNVETEAITVTGCNQGFRTNYKAPVAAFKIERKKIRLLCQSVSKTPSLIFLYIFHTLHKTTAYGDVVYSPIFMRFFLDLTWQKFDICILLTFLLTYLLTYLLT
jgi:hypothetical protein